MHEQMQGCEDLVQLEPGQCVGGAGVDADGEGGADGFEIPQGAGDGAVGVVGEGRADVVGGGGEEVGDGVDGDFRHAEVCEDEGEVCVDDWEADV